MVERSFCFYEVTRISGYFPDFWDFFDFFGLFNFKQEETKVS